jgi:hypothetical protein
MAAQNLRFHQNPIFEVFMDLVAHPNARLAVTTPISAEPGRGGGDAQGGGDPVLLTSEVQAERAPRRPSLPGASASGQELPVVPQ